MKHDSADSRKTQILALLVRARGGWVPLPEILKVGGAQFGARLYEIRHRLGLKVENRKEHHSGQTHSWYRLQTGAPIDSLFGDLTPTRYPD